MEILQDEKKPVVEKGRLKWAHQREFVATARVRNSIKSKLKKFIFCKSTEPFVDVFNLVFLFDKISR